MGKENAKWYVLHTYSGYENQVEMNLKMVFEKNNMTDRLYEITIPMEEVMEEKNGKKKLVKRKMFPCYVLIKMEYDNDSMWHIITQTRGVTGFVGPQVIRSRSPTTRYVVCIWKKWSPRRITPRATP